MEESKEPEEIFCYDQVFLKKTRASNITELDNSGSLSLFKKNKNEYFIEWKANERFFISDYDTGEDWSVVDKIAQRNRTESETLIFNTTTTNAIITSKDLNKDNNTIKTKFNENSLSSSPSSSSNLSSQNATQSKPKSIKININDLKYMEILNNDNEILFVNKNDESENSQYFFQQRNANNFIQNLIAHQVVRQKSKFKKIYEIKDSTMIDENQVNSFEGLNISDIKNSRSIIGGSVVNDFFIRFAEMIPPIANPIPMATTQAATNTHNISGEEYEVLSSSNVNSHENEIKEMEEKLPARRKISRSSCLNEKTWREFQSEDGRISDVEKVKEIIFRGGIENQLRREVWKYLLNYSPWQLTHEQRNEYHKKKNDEYFLMKLQWKSMTKTQEDNFTGYRDRKCQIEKDVKRTDRTEEFFAGDNNPNLDLLQDILMTYVMYNFDLGYVQGMSDLLAPILYVMKNEQESFWCFVGFMEKVFSNFDIDQAGMKKQLHQLAQLVSFTCPRLYNYLKETNSDNMYFCFRWLLVWFKREFSHAHVLELWEVIWSGLPCKNFHLFICVAILEMQMSTFIENSYEFTDIVKHINELSLKLNLKLCLENAEAIYYQVKESTHISQELKIIIGDELSDSEDSDDDLELNNIKRTTNKDEKVEKEIIHTNETSPTKEDMCELSMNYSFL